MRMRTLGPAVMVGALAFGAAWGVASAGDPADGAFDSAEVKEIAARIHALSIDDELAVVNRIRKSFDEKLLTVPNDAWTRHESLRGRTDAGMARILARGTFEEFVTPRGGGAYWSFTKRSNDYDKSPQLEFNQGQFSSGFYGGTAGLVRRVGDGDFGAIDEASVPPELTQTPDEVYESDHGKPRAAAQGGLGGGRASPAINSPRAEVGGVYVVRAVMWDDCDVLAAFEVVAMDRYGATIAWRILKNYDVPKNFRDRRR